MQSSEHIECLSGIVETITYHNPENGWSVLKVSPASRPNERMAVVVFQTKVFAGATMDFYGSYVTHPTFGEQFKAVKVVEKKPASTTALEKYLGSGLIFGVGPKTAKKIVDHFGNRTLDIFENHIEKLVEVDGIKKNKLKMISEAWSEHREVRNVMLFLQEFDISTVFAVKIYKAYGSKAVEIVRNNPYQLARDIFGIVFLSADKIALKVGIKPDDQIRICAGVKHLLNSAREEGHCYLTFDQINDGVLELLNLTSVPLKVILQDLVSKNEIINLNECYYAKSLYFDEQYVFKKIKSLMEQACSNDDERVKSWLDKYKIANEVTLSDEQLASIIHIVKYPFSILTGGPGCGKTTTTKILVKLIQAMGKNIILAAPTGRAAQRMGEVIGVEAKTIHRLLEFNPAGGGFLRNEDNPLPGNFLIVDETSMLDINLTASLLKAVSLDCQVLFIGDPDQLPSVGAGNVLNDLINSEVVPCFKLTKIFRQAAESSIIKSAHAINRGEIPAVKSPFEFPELWKTKHDSLFIDAEDATSEQAHFIHRVKNYFGKNNLTTDFNEMQVEAFSIPDKFHHVKLEELVQSQSHVEELKSVLKRVHPFSTLNYGFTATDIVLKLIEETIPKYWGKNLEIQLLTPMIKGSLGAQKLNLKIQERMNPKREGLAQIMIGEKIYRVGDRIIQKRNNYELGVFNGDIGKILKIDTETLECLIAFGNEKNYHEVAYAKENLSEIDLAYAITIHKSQGSEFDVVIIPVSTQHFKMLYRNLIYTGLTRGKKLVIMVGQRKALRMAINNIDSKVRQTNLSNFLKA
ncbi:MAG: AAA family ATPase [Bacteriovoracaceae bacterium]